MIHKKVLKELGFKKYSNRYELEYMNGKICLQRWNTKFTLSILSDQDQDDEYEVRTYVDLDITTDQKLKESVKALKLLFGV